MWILFLQFACTPTCEQVCTKLRSCSDIEVGVSNQLDCTNACLTQQEAIPEEDETQSRAFSEYKECVSQNTCEQISSGDCYDSGLYSW